MNIERKRARSQGWDERDEKLWTALKQLHSYGLIDANDYGISITEVRDLLEKQAWLRMEKE